MTDFSFHAGAPHVNGAPADGIEHTDDARVRRAVAHDADEQARNLHGWRQIYDQLSAGRFTGTIEELFLDRMTVFREVTSHTLRQTCEVTSDAYWFGIAHCADGLGRVDGHVIAQDALAFRPGGVEFELLTPADYEFYGLVVKGDVLRRYATEVEHSGLTDRSSLTDVIGTGLARKAQLVALLRPVFGHGEVALSGVARDYLQSSILSALFDLCTAPHGQPLTIGTAQRRQALVAQARDYAIANRERPISVPELCEHLHVSRRTLQYCFQEALGMAPAAYLRRIRLNGARRNLMEAARDSGNVAAPRSVQDIAAAWGFWHLSQFATDYRRLFGVRPSETLKGIAAAMPSGELH